MSHDAQPTTFTDRLLRGEVTVEHQRDLRLISGANTVSLDTKGTQYTVAEVQKKMKEVLNLRGDEAILVNGQRIADPMKHTLNGTENVEFVREAGHKG